MWSRAWKQIDHGPARCIQILLSCFYEVVFTPSGPVCSEMHILDMLQDGFVLGLNPNISEIITKPMGRPVFLILCSPHPSSHFAFVAASFCFMACSWSPFVSNLPFYGGSTRFVSPPKYICAIKIMRYFRSTTCHQEFRYLKCAAKRGLMHKKHFLLLFCCCPCLSAFWEDAPPPIFMTTLHIDGDRPTINPVSRP